MIDAGTATLLWRPVVSLIVARIVQAVAGLCVSAEAQPHGLGVSLRGERA